MNFSSALTVCVLTGCIAGCSGMPLGKASVAAANGQHGKTRVAADSSGLRIKKSKRGNMESYVVAGRRYHTLEESDGYSARGIASWYGPNFHGRTTSNGEVYDMYRMTAAHKSLPLPTYARVTHLENGKAIIVKINDRGPFSGERLIDLSFAAALNLGMVNDGTAMVELQVLSPEELMEISGPNNSLDVEFHYQSAEGTLQASASEMANSSDGVTALSKLEDGELVTVAAVYNDVQPTKLLDTSSAPALQTIPAVDRSLPPIVAASKLPVELLPTLDTVKQEGDIDNALSGDKSSQKSIQVAAVSVVSLPEQVARGTSLVASSGIQRNVKKTNETSVEQYYVHAGVFPDVADAERIAVDVVLQIPLEEVHVKPLKGTDMYRVTVGPIADAVHMKKVTAKLNAAGVDNYAVKVRD